MTLETNGAHVTASELGANPQYSCPWHRGLASCLSFATKVLYGSLELDE